MREMTLPTYDDWIDYVADKIKRLGPEEGRRTAANIERNITLDKAKLYDAAKRKVEKRT